MESHFLLLQRTATVRGANLPREEHSFPGSQELTGRLHIAEVKKIKKEEERKKHTQRKKKKKTLGKNAPISTCAGKAKLSSDSEV